MKNAKTRTLAMLAGVDAGESIIVVGTLSILKRESPDGRSYFLVAGETRTPMDAETATAVILAAKGV